MQLLGLKKVCNHIDAIFLFFLIGWAYHQGTRRPSHRRATPLTRPPHCWPTTWRVEFEAIWREAPILCAIRKLTTLLTDHLQTDVELVSYVGEGEAFAGLTEAGELFWRVVADYLRKNL